MGLVRPGDPSWCPVTPSFGERPAAGRQRVFLWEASPRAVKSHLGSADVVCHFGGTRDRGLFASVLLSRVLTEAVGLLREQPVRRTPQASLAGTCRTHCVHWTWGAGTHARKLTAQLETSVSSFLGDWVLIAQKDIGSPPFPPWRSTREHLGSPRHVSQGTQLDIRLQPFFLVGLDQAGAGPLTGSTPAPYGCVVGSRPLLAVIACRQVTPGKETENWC